jgi:ATP-dependent Zn protease
MTNDKDMKAFIQTAYHEAGHYVAKAAMLGRCGMRGIDAYGDTLSIVPDEEALGRHTNLEWDLGIFDGRETVLSPELVRAYIVYCYGGISAQRKVSSEEDEEFIKRASWYDDEAAAEWLHMAQDSEDELRQMTKDVIEENWAAVERLARELVEHKFLDMDECNLIYEGDMDGLAEYRQFKLSLPRE